LLVWPPRGPLIRPLDVPVSFGCSGCAFA
jgi:hypothetical protein